MTPDARLLVSFERGQDDTHPSRLLPSGMGVACYDADLRGGDLAARPDPKMIADATSGKIVPPPTGEPLWTRWPGVGMAVLPRPDGTHALILCGSYEPEVPGCAKYALVYAAEGIHFEGDKAGALSPPHYKKLTMLKGENGVTPIWIQGEEPVSFFTIGHKLYVLNAGFPFYPNPPRQPPQPGPLHATLEIDGRSLRGRYLTDWPRARCGAVYYGSPALGGLWNDDQLTIQVADPLDESGNYVFGTYYDRIPGDPGDMIMQMLVYNHALYVWTRRSVWAYFGTPDNWEKEQILDVGTLCPETVKVVAGKSGRPLIYFLGSDGVPRIMDGTPGHCEAVGQYADDGLCPVQNSLREHVIQPSASYGVESWNSQYDWERCNLGENMEIDGSSVRLKMVDAQDYEEEYCETFLLGEWAFIPWWHGAEIWQTFSVQAGHPFTNGVFCSAITIQVVQTPNRPGIYRLRLSLAKHLGDSQPNSAHTVLAYKEVNVTLSPGEVDPENVTFTFDSPVTLQVDDEGEPLGVPVYYRFWVDLREVTPIGGNPTREPRYLYNRGLAPEQDAYLRGRRYGSGKHTDFYFRAHFKYYFGAATMYSQTVQPGTISRWVSANWVNDVPEHTEFFFHVKNELGDWVEVKSSGDIISFLKTSEWVQFRVRLARNVYHPVFTPVLYSVFLHYLTAGDFLDTPTAVEWDGRYCLMLARKDAARTRDMAVFDRGAWSWWRGVGATRAAVLPDAKARPRLVYADWTKCARRNEPTATACRVLCLLEDERDLSYRPANLEFQTGDLVMAGGDVGRLRGIRVLHTDGGYPGWLWFSFRAEGKPWQRLTQAVLLRGDRREKLAVRDVPRSEGRFVRVRLGGNQDDVSRRPQVPCRVQLLTLEVKRTARRPGVTDGSGGSSGS